MMIKSVNSCLKTKKDLDKGEPRGIVSSKSEGRGFVSNNVWDLIHGMNPRI